MVKDVTDLSATISIDDSDVSIDEETIDEWYDQYLDEYEIEDNVVIDDHFKEYVISQYLNNAEIEVELQ